MSRWTGAWLPGTGTATADDVEQRYRGERLGLVEHGAGSVASPPARLGAFVLDLIIAGLLAGLFVHANPADTEAMWVQQIWGSAIWFVLTTIAVSLFGFTPGMAACGVRVARVDGAAMVGPVRAIARTLLTVLIIPVVVWDRDYRGLHDKVAGTVMVRTR
ncbi:MAG: RDD family protein [Sciscionella sp.]|nr:RDD family protein [Sciscionella sp.]